MFWILHGEDEFRRSEFLARLKKDLGDPAIVSLNTTVLDGRKLSLNEIILACDTMPFLGDKRLVIVDGLLTRPTTGKKQEKNKPSQEANESAEVSTSASAQRQFLADLKAYLHRLPTTTILVFVESQPIASNHSLRALAQGPSALGQVQEFRPFSTLKKNEGPSQLAKWIKDQARSQALELSPDAVKALATFVGYDLRLLNQEIEKLSVYAADSRKVSGADVRQLVSYVQEADIFEMVDALGRREGPRTVALLHQMLDQGKAPLYLLSMIIRQFRIVIQVKELDALGYTETEMARELNLHEFVVEKTLRQARGFSFQQLSALYESLAQADEAIKTGRMGDTLALDLLIAEMCTA